MDTLLVVGVVLAAVSVVFLVVKEMVKGARFYGARTSLISFAIAIAFLVPLGLSAVYGEENGIGWYGVMRRIMIVFFVVGFASTVIYDIKADFGYKINPTKKTKQD